ncbi:MAG: hypothetical protein ACYC4L_08915 [Chloroflexota bacterium]
MDPYRYLPPDRRPARFDFGLLAIFIMTIGLFVGVVAFLTAGWAWTPPDIENPLKFETRSSGLFGADVVEHPEPTPVGTKPSLAVGAAPTGLTATTAPSATSTTVPPTATATSAPTNTPSPSATPQPTNFILANTGGVGAWLRRSPRMNDYLVTWVDGTRFEQVGPDVQSPDGMVWKNVRDPRGNVGFMPAEWMSPAP